MEKIRNIDGKVVGHINNCTFYKKVKYSKHFMKVLNGFGCDTRILAHDFDTFKILDTENDTLYVSKKSDWLEHGIRKNFGYGDQIILPLRHHEVRNRKQIELIK